MTRMARWFTFIVVVFLAGPVFAQSAPTCEEQVTLLQGYVTELANQRGALESRLILTQAELKKSQIAPVPAAAHPDVDARMKQIEAEKERVQEQKKRAVK